MGQDAKVVPAVATFDKWVKKVDPQTQLDLYTLYGWISAAALRPSPEGRRGRTRPGPVLDAQLDKITSFNANGLIATQNPAQKIPGQCWLVTQYENGHWKRIAPTRSPASSVTPAASTRAATRASPR